MKLYQPIVLFACASAVVACNKKEFLDADPITNSSTISTLADCRGLLNNKELFNETPSLGEITADDYMVMPALWVVLSDQERNACTWKVDIFEGKKSIPDYNRPYSQVHVANEILASLPAIRVNDKEKNEKMDIEGAARFVRAYAFYNLLQVFARPYDSTSAATDTGIALPLAADVNEDFYRATMKESYSQVINDLVLARKLLNNTEPARQPSQQAADAMLARVFLVMGQYSKAGFYANSCLQQYDRLIDFNQVDTANPYPFTAHTGEILYHSYLIDNNIIKPRISTDCIIASDLYGSYAANDLRRDVFYKINTRYNLPYYRASYSARVITFSGLATDEIYLIRAECRARAQDVQGALNDLNTLLRNRYKTGTFIPRTALSWQDALEQVLTERRKELVFRGLRFTDLRRLNKEGAGKWISREANFQRYQLPPNDLRYTLPIPEDAIAGSHIVQNPRQ